MNYKETTQVPNILFDSFLQQLKPCEVIVLLVIIRQTVGWYNPITKKRKVRDWISYKQFKKKTNLSIKTISQSINRLIELCIIKATDINNITLDTPQKRQGKVRIFYQCLLIDRQNKSSPYVKKYKEHRKVLPITKLTPTKLKQQKEKQNNYKRLSDSERYQEILNHNNPP